MVTKADVVTKMDRADKQGYMYPPASTAFQNDERTVFHIRLDWQYNDSHCVRGSEAEARARIEEIRKWHPGSIFLLEVKERIVERINHKVMEKYER